MNSFATVEKDVLLLICDTKEPVLDTFQQQRFCGVIPNSSIDPELLIGSLTATKISYSQNPPIKAWLSVIVKQGEFK